MGSGSRRRAAVVLTVSALAAATLRGGFAVPPNGLAASVVSVSPAIHTHSYDVINTAGSVVGTSTWRVVHGTGNCCENYLASTPSGRLLNLGGGHVFFSDDRGASWGAVRPPIPLVGAEGAIVAAPGGEVAAFTWDPYGGDRVISYKLEGGRWYYTEGVLHVPFPDRPWISVVPGPVLVAAGQTIPYLTVMKAGWPFQELWLQSLDGLNYVRPSAPSAENATAKVTSWLDVKPDPMLDYVQPSLNALTAPLGGGRALAFRAGSGLGCDVGMLGAEGTWACFALPSGRSLGHVVADSRGWLHDVSGDGHAKIRHAISTDGGRSWTTTTFPLPPGYVMDDDAGFNRGWDFRANGTAGMAAIAIHTRSSSGRHQDLVYKISVATSKPALTKMMRVGRGDLAFDGSLTKTGARFDFPSIAILPDGRVAVSFGDASHSTPQVAIET